MINLRFSGSSEDFLKFAYQTKHSACFDLCSQEHVDLNPGECKAISTGLFIDSFRIKRINDFILGLVYLELNPYLEIISRSGLALKNQVIVLNAPARIDCDYKDEIKVILMNLGKDSFFIKKGDRIAQCNLQYCERVSGISVRNIERNGGFGSTGV